MPNISRDFPNVPLDFEYCSGAQNVSLLLSLIIVINFAVLSSEPSLLDCATAVMWESLHLTVQVSKW